MRSAGFRQRWKTGAQTAKGLALFKIWCSGTVSGTRPLIWEEALPRVAHFAPGTVS